MAQGILPFQYQEETTGVGTTALAGLPLYLELAHVLGIVGSIRQRLQVRNGSQGWTDVQVVMAIVLLNIAGGDCVEDLERLEADQGFSGLLRRVELHHLPRSQRRELERRWRKARERAVPSPSSVFRYLEAFHDSEQETLRQDGKAFIPKPNANLLALRKVLSDFLQLVQTRSPQTEATLDTDATIVRTFKANALCAYKDGKGYQPLNVWWAEQGMVLHSEFRDGNVPAGFEIKRVVQEALEMLPAGVTNVAVRSDTAAYQHEFLSWLVDPEQHPRFGTIPFAIGCDVSEPFKRAVLAVANADWNKEYREESGHLVPTGREWAQGQLCSQRDGVLHEGCALSLSRHPGTARRSTDASRGSAAPASLSECHVEWPALQDPRHRHQPRGAGRLDRRSRHPVALPAVR